MRRNVDAEQRERRRSDVDQGRVARGDRSRTEEHARHQLRVHGLQGLRVIDASVMPRMISANLNASTMMIADRASDLIRGKQPMEPARVPDAAVA